MKYLFKLVISNNKRGYMIDSEESVLNNLGGRNWTPEKVQEMIDGVENAKTTDEIYTWSSEDILFDADSESVLINDMMAIRGGTESEEAELELSPNDFIQFLKDFKKFIEENS
jgi:hypothetical protein